MPGPDYGALGATFKVTRGIQVASIIAVIGMASNFISEMVTAQVAPPNVLIGTLSVVSATRTLVLRTATDLTRGTGLCRSFILHHNGHSTVGWLTAVPYQHHH